MKVVRLSAPRTVLIYTPGNISGTHFCYRLSQPQGHSAAGRIMSMKNLNDSIGNQTRDLPDCSAVPQPTVSPRTPFCEIRKANYYLNYVIEIRYSRVHDNAKCRLVAVTPHVCIAGVTSLYLTSGTHKKVFFIPTSP